LKPTVWLFATLSLMLPKASDCDVRPLIALFIAPKIDILGAPEVLPGHVHASGVPGS
jgi:hypothetical protein